MQQQGKSLKRLVHLTDPHLSRLDDVKFSDIRGNDGPVISHGIYAEASGTSDASYRVIDIENAGGLDFVTVDEQSWQVEK